MSRVRVVHIAIKHFRGFSEFVIAPTGHVLLIGEPRAGRSDLLAAIELTLGVDTPRNVSEFDFHYQERGER
jgi:hypothetical protein